jgi:hypothetical protein
MLIGLLGYERDNDNAMKKYTYPIEPAKGKISFGNVWTQIKPQKLWPEQKAFGKDEGFRTRARIGKKN